jgi:hypothetical protein
VTISKSPETFAICNSLARTTKKYVGALLLLVSLFVFCRLIFSGEDGLGLRLVGLFLFASLLLILKFDSRISKAVDDKEYALLIKSDARFKLHRAFKQAAISNTSNIEGFFDLTLALNKKVSDLIGALCKAMHQAIEITLTPKLLTLPQTGRA